MAFTIARFIKEEGVTNNKEFYESDKTFFAYGVFLGFDICIQVILTSTLMLSVCRLAPNLKSFFKGQF